MDFLYVLSKIIIIFIIEGRSPEVSIIERTELGAEIRQKEVGICYKFPMKCSHCR
jgi:hypothetical protein